MDGSRTAWELPDWPTCLPTASARCLDSLCCNPAIESMIDADPIAACVREFMSERTSWTGSAADLLRVSVERSSDRIPRDGTGWPKTPAPSPATCVAHRRFFGRSVSRLRSVAKADPEAE